jgi:hypothetical protein
MAFSVQRELHIDTHLTNLAINYRPQNFIADQIAPIVPVDKESNSYPIFSRFENFAIEDTTRSRGTEAKKVTRSVSSANYLARNYALGFDVTVEDLANMDAAFRGELDLGAAKYLVGKLGLDMERRVLTLATNTAAVSSVFVPSSAWNVTGTAATPGGDPFSQVMQMIEQVQGFTGQRPNSILIGWKAWNYMRRNYNMRNLINGVNNRGGTVTRDQVASIFEVDRFLVSEALWHTANENAVNSGQLTANPMTDKLLVYYAPMAPSREDPSFMYSFRWTPNGYPAPFTVERHAYDTRKKVETIEAGYFQDERVTGSDYGALLVGVGSAQANGLT